MWIQIWEVNIDGTYWNARGIYNAKEKKIILLQFLLI